MELSSLVIWLFYLFNLDELFKINLFLLMVLGFVGALYERKIFSAVLAVCLVVSLLCLPCWNRSGHHVGYFRVRQPLNYHFKKFFSVPENHKGDVLFF